MSRILQFEITDAGLDAAFNGTNTGLSTLFSHIALGSGLAQQAYEPNGTETALRGEFMRRPVGQGERIAPNEILLQCLFDGAETGVIREIGLFTSTNVLFAVWSGPPVGEKYNGVPYIFAESLVLDGIDLDRYPNANLSWVAGGPTINLFMDGPFITLIADNFLQHRLGLNAFRLSITPVIQKMWS